MIAVIIAGGSGTRLWPLSTPDFPKHLLSLTGRRSLVQYTYDRAKTLSDQIYVLTDASHAKHIKKQLPEIKDSCFIIEPARRGTVNCILLALRQIAKTNKDEPIAFLAADHFIRNTAEFTKTFKSAGKVSEQTNRIVLIGVEPDYPATGFGYIQKNGDFESTEEVYNVHSFKEKPDYKQAQEYLKSSNYLWNCGYFVGSVNAFTEAMTNAAPDLLATYQKLSEAKNRQARQEVYLELKTDSIDYALIEKNKELLVIPAHFDWMDLGSYGDLHKASQRNSRHNHIHGDNIELEGVENSYVYNQEDKPVAVIGLNNVVVVNTKDGLLVVRKDFSQHVGEVSKKFKDKKKAKP